MYFQWKLDPKMFDPTHIGSLPADAVKYYEPRGSNNSHQSFFVILTIQNIDYAVILKLNTNHLADPVVIDRMKYMCEIEPSHVVILKLPYKIEYGELLPSNSYNEFLMYRANIRVISTKMEIGTAKFQSSVKCIGIQD